MNQKLPDVQAGFRKGRGTRDQFANVHWIIEQAREFQENIYLSFINYIKLLTMWIIINCGKLFKRGECQTILPVSWETCMQIKKQQLEPCTEQLIGSRLRKEYDRAVCCHPVCLIYTLSTSWEMLGWMRGENYQQPQLCRWYHSNGKKQRGTKEPLDENEEGE